MKAQRALRKATRDVVAAVAPQVLEMVNRRREATAKAYFKDIWARRYKLRPRLEALLGTTIPRGPFAGMDYDPTAERWQACKLLGCYEAELNGIVELLISRKPERIINIGCGEGYYTVGLARRCPWAAVDGYDTDAPALDVLRHLAQRNHVENIKHVGGLCTATDLHALAGTRTLVICDIEGGEVELFAPAVIASLAESDVLIEMHDFIVPDATPIVVDRFRGTHLFSLVHTVGQRDPRHYRELEGFSEQEVREGLDEDRCAPMTWGVFISKTPRD
jgi:SAM-dependent methyltransferase